MNVREIVEAFFNGASVEALARKHAVSEAYIEDLIRAWKYGAEWAQKVEDEG